MDREFTRHGNIVVPRPNWQDTVSESFEYLTEVFASEDGEESRYAHRMMPRISVRYRGDMIEGPARQIFEDYVRPDDDRQFVVPVRWRNTSMSAGVSAGASRILIGDSKPWWIQTGAALVIEDGDVQHVHTVEATGTTGSTHHVDLVAPVATDISAGAIVMLGYWSHYPQTGTFAAIVRSHRRMTPDFLANPGRLPEWEIPAATGPIYKGYEVLPGRHNWTKSLETELDDRRETVDYGRGVIDNSWSRRHRVQIEKRVYTSLTQADADDLLHTFMRHRGMRKPFWTVAPDYTFPQHNYASEGATQFYLIGDSWSDNFDGDPIYRHVWVQWPDGAVQINRIAASNTSSGNRFFLMEDPWERDIASDTDVRWAMLARFATDRLEFEWVTSEICEATLPVRALRCGWVDEDAQIYATGLHVSPTDLATDWTDPTTYSEINFANAGGNMELIAAGEATIEAGWRAKTPPTAPNTWVARLDIAFFDGAGVQIGVNEGDSITTTSKVGDTSVATIEMSATEAVPATATSARLRVVLTRDYESKDIDFGALAHREWGPAASGSNLKWF